MRFQQVQQSHMVKQVQPWQQVPQDPCVHRVQSGRAVRCRRKSGVVPMVCGLVLLIGGLAGLRWWVWYAGVQPASAPLWSNGPWRVLQGLWWWVVVTWSGLTLMVFRRRLWSRGFWAMLLLPTVVLGLFVMVLPFVCRPGRRR